MLFLLANEELIRLFTPFRLFEYVTFRAAGAAVTAFLLVMIFGPATVRRLKQFRATAPCRYGGLIPEAYIDREKDKTPSMGGVLIIGAITIASLLWANMFNPIAQTLVLLTLSLALLGFADDFAKVAYRRRDGIPGKVKMIFQIAIGTGAVLYLWCDPNVGEHMSQLMVPFYAQPVWNSIWVLPLSVVVIVGASNAVNLTDGKDGLASGSVIFCVLTYAVIAYLCGHKVFAEYLKIPSIVGVSEAVVFASAIVGACIGFLWYNCHPAAMFMGDTGSLALGGAVGLLAVIVKQEILLILVGGVFVMEALSVILQVGSFKLTGKRIFLCAPIHHHFERLGWTETQIVVRFWILAGVFALLSLATLKIR